ncbi:MAG: M48 family metalloprotease [Deltaproteobacteria bacterium]|nr:M48 family metalloprotease [Candidatus Zymogenaceae bacterium]
MKARVISCILGASMAVFLFGCVTGSMPGYGYIPEPTVNDVVDAVTTIAPALLPMSEAEEIAIGQAIAAEVAGRYGVMRNNDLTRYVNLVGKTVARKSDRPELEYRFAVLDTDIINSFACPGGYIFITRGALEAMTTEAELAAVLAHEVAHVAKKHIVKEIEQKQFLEAGGTAAANYLDADPRIFNMATAHGTELLFKGLSRTDEYQADKNGIIYAAEAGYDATGLVSFLETLKNVAGSDSTEGISMLFSTHPDIDDRIGRASSVISTRGYDDAGGAVCAERFADRIGSLNSGESEPMGRGTQ